MQKVLQRFFSTTFFAFSFYLFTSPLAAIVTPTVEGPVMTETGTSVVWQVAEGETLTGIAAAYYGDASYWTTIWNDNPWIENPWLIEEDWVLELRNRIPYEPQAIDPELMTRIQDTPYYYYPEIQQHPSLIREEVVVATPVVSQPTVIPQSVVPTATPPVQVSQVNYAGGPLSEAQITYLGQCEAGMDPAKNTGNGYYGAFQFSYGTWKSMGTGYERADMAPIEVQKDAVQRLLSRSSIYTQFPGCARKMQSLGMI